MNVSPDIFCNSPWHELHIYWNGDYGFCCQQFDPPYDKASDHPYNISRMTIREWYDSGPMREARMRMFSEDKWTNCSFCWAEEASGDTSRRIRGNQKSVIFRKQFQDSFRQSPNFSVFKHSHDNQGATDRLPIDLHVDLGNYCNLACKMCWAGASSKIATQEKKWGILTNEKYLRNDWTRDDAVWNKFLKDMEDLPLKNIHFMGGETTLQPRFRDFVDHMLDAGRTDLNISYVTNGTNFDEALVEKLTRFNRIGIEVSIETVTETNQYVRQGTDTKLVLENIDRYRKYVGSVTARPAIGALSIRDFHTLLEYCLDKEMLMKALIVNKPTFLKVSVLPKEVRERYKENYQHLIDPGLDIVDINESDAKNHRKIIAQYAQQAINLLDQEETEGIGDMVAYMRKWDDVYGYDARVLYPELVKILDQHGY